MHKRRVPRGHGKVMTGFNVYLCHPMMGELKISHVARKELFDEDALIPFLYDDEANAYWCYQWNQIIRDRRYELEFRDDSF